MGRNSVGHIQSRAGSDDYVATRLDHIEQLRALGVQAYPERFEVDFSQIGSITKSPDQIFSVAGRVLSIRRLGRQIFATIGDITGRIQVSLNKNHLVADQWDIFRRFVRAGDHIGVHGSTFYTRTGEFTLEAETLTILGIALRPLPEKWHGLVDPEIRYRKRYLDLIANEASRQVFRARSHLTWAIRNFLHAADFFEVDTRVLQHTSGGALARPFFTHHNTYDIPCTLRIAPELDLKRAIAAGFPRVYEIADCFRNEGVSPDHLQEFRMLEYYSAYWNYEDNMAFSRQLLQHILQEAFGTLSFDCRSEEDSKETVDFSGIWSTVTYKDSIRNACGINIDQYDTAEDLRKACVKLGLNLEKADYEHGNLGRLIDTLYKKVARPRLRGPIFLIGHPISTSPLARRNDDNPRKVDRFQLVVAGVELMNGYSELVDPIDQRQRLEVQAAYKGTGDDEAMDLDEDYLLCMEHGMPPISGCGLGIDRLLKIVLGLPNIRDVVLFPFMRPAN